MHLLSLSVIYMNGLTAEESKFWCLEHTYFKWEGRKKGLIFNC